MSSVDHAVISDSLLSVAIPRPIHRLFTYRLPGFMKSQVRVGGWVRVPFGSSSTHAFVVEDAKSLDTLPQSLPLESIKSVLEVGGQIPADVWALCKWAHEYYGAPIGEVFNCAAALMDIRSRRSEKVSVRKKKRVEVQLDIENVQVASPELTKDQQVTLSTIIENSKTPGSVTLLRGVTGSGKTEVYIELARKVLAAGQSVLVLVPEIALTPQLHQRFEGRLGVSVGLWHSALSPGRRAEQSAAMLDGKLRVLVGARSAIFAPVQNLGLIVIDEEHDPTYKQEDRVQYHARDLAVVRGKFTGAAVVLGSATPSLETLERVREGKYSITRLDQRISQSGFPQIELVDLGAEELVEGTQALFAQRSVAAMQTTLSAGGQILIFLNRRGFAAFLICKDCKAVKECHQCSVSLTVHKRMAKLCCHSCGHEEPIPDFCVQCQSYELCAVGAGTESLETDIPLLLAEAKVQRLDRDQITSTTRLNQVLNDFRKGKTNILLGTQMLVKGHDFPGVTLVVVVLADSLFRWPDFRAPERAYQVLKQVAGRAGRGDQPGRVLIQTYDPEHPVLKTLLGTLSEESFLENERELREALEYPPFARLARMRFESTSRTEAALHSQEVAELLRTYSPSLRILGPSEAFLERVRGIYRWDLLVKSKDIRQIHTAMRQARVHAVSHQWSLSIDVDPLGI